MTTMKRTERIQIRVTPKERELIDRARGPASLSNWSRHILLLTDRSNRLFLENLAGDFDRKADQERSGERESAWRDAAAMVRRRLNPRAAERETRAKGGKR